MTAVTRQPLWLRILLPALALYALSGYLLLPWALKQLAPGWVATALDARLEIGDLHFDPFRLRLLVFEARLVGPLDHEDFAAEEVVGARRIEAALLLRSLLEFSPVIALEVDAPRLRLERSSDGSINLSALTRPAGAEADTGSSAATLGLQRLIVRDGQMTLLDRSRPQPFRASVDAIEVDLRELWLPAGEPAPIWAALQIEGAALDLRGHIAATPEMDLAVTLVHLPLELGERWLAGAGPTERLRGRLHGSGQLTQGEDGRARLADGEVHIHGLDLSLPQQLAAIGTDFEARLRELRVDAIAGDLWPLDLELGALTLQQGQIGIRYEGAAPPAEQTPALAPTPTANAGPELALRLAALDIVDVDFAVTDASLARPAQLDLSLQQLRAENLRWPAAPGQSAPVEIEVALPPNGQSHFSGELDLSARGLQGRLESSRLPLPSFAPWVHAFTRLGIASGELDQQADVVLDWDTQPMDLRLKLDASVESLAVNDPDGIGLIAWDRLDLRSLDLDLAQRRLALQDAALLSPSLRFARLADGRTNLERIGPVSEAPPANSGEDAPPATEHAAWDWKLHRLTVDAGQLDFIDETLVIPFATRVEALSGSVENLASNADSRAELHLDGRIPPSGSARIEARSLLLDPLADTAFTLDFRGVPMPRMTPWTGTFAGYRVAGGRLALDLNYRIEQGALTASNKVTVNAMRLGEPMDSPRAMDLPLRLALALMRDGDDNIVLEVPVSGNVEDPQFDFTPAIMRAIRNVLVSIVAAPFRLLAGLVGGSDEGELERVVYALGSATLDEDQEAHLLTLERALGQRPALGLSLPAVHAGEADRAALRAEALEQALAQRSADRAEALQLLFREREGNEAFEALLAVYSESEARSESLGTGDAEAAGTLLTELENRLLGDIVIRDEALEALARRRAEAVYLYLTDAGLDRGRLRIAADSNEVELRGDEVPLEFELDALEP